MLRQSSSRNYRGKKLIRPRDTFQAVLLFAVGIWIMYQLTRSYGKRRAVVVEADDGNNAVDGAEVARRRLGRKGFVGFAGHASESDMVGVGRNEDDVGSHGAGWGDASSDDDPSGKADDREGGDGDEEGEASDEDGSADDEEDEDGVDAGDEEDDDRDFISQNAIIGNSEDDLNFVFGNGDADDGTHLHEPKELNSSAVPLGKATGSVQDAAASQQTNATDGVADHSANVVHSTDFSLKNASAVNLSLHVRGIAGDAAEKIVANSFTGRAAGAANGNHNVSVVDNLMTKQNETADSVQGRGISS